MNATENISIKTEGLSFDMNDVFKLMESRHSVRRYTDEPMGEDVIKTLNEEIALCNKEGRLNMQLITDEPEAFNGFMAHYGKFSGVKNYIAVVAEKGRDFDERCGYYGERVVLKAQELGLNTCWVALTYSKGKSVYKVGKGEKFSMIISVGYGIKQGRPHISKPFEEVAKVGDGQTIPEWFRRGVEAALLAPTAINQQKFSFTLNGNKVKAKALFGPYSKVDLGIAKYHFELGAGKDNFEWE